MAALTGLKVAIFPWGDVVEEFLDPLGLDLDAFAADMTGGWLFGYVAALLAAGDEPVIVCASGRIASDRLLTHRATGVPMAFVPGRRRRITGASRASLMRWIDEPAGRYRRILERFGTERILCQEYEYARFDRLIALGRDMGIPVYASFQGGDRTASRLERVVRARSLTRAAGLIIASRTERDRVARDYPGLGLNIAAIFNPLAAADWRPDDRAEARAGLGLAADAFIVICHGRIDIHRKGLDVLLAAWRGVSSNRPGTELVLIGSGQDHAAFAALLHASGLDNVRWLARYTTDRDELRRWLSAADVYVSASRIEGMPVAPLEAMACGLPVVATDAQGIADIFDHGEASGAIIVARDRPEAIAAALDRLAGDPGLRQRLGAAGRLRVETAFAVAPVGEALSAFLDGRRPVQAGNARLPASIDAPPPTVALDASRKTKG